ncbi:uncharacterized protein LOC117433375 [Acipenser ruthenus]|uniref:uncharacterized protein LOC117433375 n=1 Tax=Acipenser ruthenus TaxID=7906 RepID=UPI002741D4EF|nr:uncharacterized protein LOC117433375 [Acipenser ruthenus]
MILFLQSVTMMLKVLFLSVLALASALQCPDGGMCSDDNTCCKIPSGGYSCCPLLNDISSFPMVQTGSLNDISGSVCPDNSPCPSEYSCLLTPTGVYGCCPFPQGLSCADGKHCCPDGYKCSDDGSSCTRHTEVSIVGAVICPDKESECPDETTCCELPDGSWGCCPMVKAVCCDDKVHCCPEGTRCDIAHSKCLSHESETPMWGKLLARKRAAWENNKVTKVESVACPDGKSQCPKMRWDVICPDMQTKCPSDTTCCEMPSGSYGCCPMPQAVCCEDKMHCCPEGTKCDLPHNKCVSASGESPLFKKIPALRKGQLQNKASGVQCDDTRSCADGSTCCKTRAGGWACCSLPKAVCCDDHEHCCPEDTTCDLAAGTCDQGGFSVPWLKKVPALVSEPNEEKCDDQYSCPDGNTCCKLSTGDWACCPLPHAVCCADNESCCPEGTTCDTEHKKCLSAEGETMMRKKFPAMKKNSNNGKMLVIVNGAVERDVKCDDTKSCPDGNTCCKNKQGGWGCCSFPKAVCCDDHEHCCPEDTTCDLAAGTCDQGGFSVPWLKKVPALMSEPNEEKCDDQYSCPDGNTCCKLSTGDWACCPLPHAVCCADNESCCPEGTTCDTEHKKCLSAEGETMMRKKFPAMKKNSNNGKMLVIVNGAVERDVKCDDTKSCPDGNTCCKNKQGGWGCCSFPKAVCCDDHEHCCPEDTTCDLAAGTCDQGGFSVPWLKKVPALVSEPNEEKCDDQYSCPDGNTCCKLSTGDWACCPLPHAVCCADNESCCPEGTTCDTEHKKCLSAEGETTMRKKFPAMKKNSNNGKMLVNGTVERDVKCDDTKSCPDGNTCCKNKQGGWGCCSFPKAVCCDDQEHCCPEDTTCDLAAGTCDQGGFSVPWLKKVPALVSEPNEEKCDDQYSCPDGNTCCKLSTGDWACCPLPHAVCCADNESCCPEGTTCDTEHKKCLSAEGETTMRKKFPAMKKNSNNGKMLVNGTVERDVKCDDTKSCPDGNTCCKNKQGGWGCCSFPKAVCCDDHEHCCPEDTTCDLAAGTCDQGGFSVPWLKKVPALMSEPNEEKCDDQYSCPDGSTCCKLSTGDWACCPLPHAVCCADNESCCPEGTTCDTEHKKCLSAEGETTMRKKFPAMKKNSNNGKMLVIVNGTVERDVKCDDTKSCPDGNTCCKNKQGGWGCCSFPKAVCCDDHEHCCPEDTTCDLAAGTCDQGGFSVPWLKKVPALVSEPNEEKCDDQYSCPDGNTCCKLSTGDWACCPLPHVRHAYNFFFKLFEYMGLLSLDSISHCLLMFLLTMPQAVCCADNESCCPEGTTCDTEHKKCLSAEGETTMRKKFPAMKKNSNNGKMLVIVNGTVERDVKCDDTKSCPDGNTCCKNKQGGWGCCSFPKAVCCDDHEHCCPEDTTCDLAAGTCDQGGFSVPWLKKVPALVSEPNEEKCDDQYSCPDGNTCCKLSTGDWACCPLPHAVCCADNESCCPEGTTCDTEHKKCLSAEGETTMRKKFPAMKKNSNNGKMLVIVNGTVERDVKCDDTKSCPDGNTCCKNKQGGWGCCSFPKAVCCDDHEHCCPEDTTCDLAAGTCDQGGFSVPWLKKVPALVSEPNEEKCDDQYSCPDGNTCCKLSTGDWACCPLPHAVCCADNESCCPEGTTCDTEHKKCLSAEGETTMRKKFPAMKKNSNNGKMLVIVNGTVERDVKCDDTKSCPDGNTCCKNKQGGWGCCSFPKAVCCDDHEHCCPEDTTCDLAAGTCDQGGFSVPWLKKVPALMSEPNEEKCDDQYSCPDGSTCCKLSTGDWACCPLPHAVCCADNESCCPEGTTCDTEHKKCLSAEGETTMRKKFPAMKKNSNNGKMLVIVNGAAERDVKCDDTKSCPDGNTCCKNKQGGWGCCSFPKAVCCDDHEHCCPEDTTCDLAAGTCDQGGFSVPWLKKVPALVSEPNEEKCDNQTSCPDGTTCCKLSTGDWACCPLIRAMCCDDHEHCCPKGYKCDVEQQTCVKQGLSIPWVPKKPPMKKLLSAAGAHADKNMCNEHTCPKEMTCCEMRTEKWGCCSVPNGVCCNDQEHCCPQGYQCNMQTSTCERQSLVFPWVFQKAPFYSLSAASPDSRGNDKCDDQHNCSDQQTCCKTAAGTWGCCPYSQGVCCDDLQHCCPNHYTCDKSGGKCVQSNGLIWDLLFSNKRRPFNTL